MKRSTVATKTDASDQPVVRWGSSEESELVKRIVATRANARVYYVSAVDGRAVEKQLDAEIIEP